MADHARRLETSLSAARAEVERLTFDQKTLRTQLHNAKALNATLREENSRLREFLILLKDQIEGNGMRPPTLYNAEEMIREFLLPAAPESKGGPFDDPPEYHESFS